VCVSECDWTGLTGCFKKIFERNTSCHLSNFSSQLFCGVSVAESIHCKENVLTEEDSLSRNEHILSHRLVIDGQ